MSEMPDTKNKPTAAQPRRARSGMPKKVIEFQRLPMLSGPPNDVAVVMINSEWLKHKWRQRYACDLDV